MHPATWIPLLLFIFFLGGLLDIPWVVILSSAGIIIIGVSELWSFLSLRNVKYQRKWIYRRGFPGETTHMRIEVENRKWLPVTWLRTIDSWPMAVAPKENTSVARTHLPELGQLINVLNVRGFEKISRTYELLFRRRGVYKVGPLQMESGDLFGLYHNQKEDPETEELVVFPDILPLADIQIPSQDPFGDRSARKHLFEDPNRPIGVRPYQPEDEFRRVHWSATARTGTLQVKVYQPVSAKAMMVCLNVITQQRPWLGTSSELLEYLIKVSATLVYEGTQEGYAVGLISNGCLAHADHPFRILPGRSPGQLANVLQALAALTPYNTALFEDYLTKSMPHIPYGATLMVVSALISPLLCETLVRLKRYRPNITLIAVGENPPPNIPGVRSIYLPYA